MEPFEIMVSESQERMLCVVEPDAARRGARGLRDAGRSTRPRSARSPTRGRLRVFDGEALVGDMPVDRAGRRVPGLRPRARASRRVPIYPAPPSRCSTPARRRPTRCSRCSASPNLASRRWAFEQYDCVVGSRTVRRPEQADAAVLLLDRRLGAIAVSIDGNGRRVAADPYRGAVEAVLECSANLACVGAEPLGLTNCLNFGNPEKPHIAWQLTRAVARPRRRLPRARRAGRRRQRLALQRGRRRARSTRRRSSAWSASCPTRARAGRLGFAGRGRRGRADRRAVVGAVARPAPSWPSCAASRSPARCPHADLGELRALHAAVRQAVRAGALRSAHDVAEGGARGRAGRVLPRRRPRRAVDVGARRPRRPRCSARARARSSSPARAGAARVRRRARSADRRTVGGVRARLIERRTQRAALCLSCSARPRRAAWRRMFD